MKSCKRKKEFVLMAKWGCCISCNLFELICLSGFIYLLFGDVVGGWCRLCCRWHSLKKQIEYPDLELHSVDKTVLACLRWFNLIPSLSLVWLVYYVSCLPNPSPLSITGLQTLPYSAGWNINLCHLGRSSQGFKIMPNDFSLPELQIWHRSLFILRLVLAAFMSCILLGFFSVVMAHVWPSNIYKENVLFFLFSFF